MVHYLVGLENFLGDLWLAGRGSCRLGLEVGFRLEELVGDSKMVMVLWISTIWRCIFRQGHWT